MAKNKKGTATLPIVVILLAIITIVNAVSSHNNRNNNVNTTQNENGLQMIVHFLDVGQGDCEFIELPNDECMLIDAGNKDNSDYIINTISELGYDRIDYVVATHPHVDHIGSMTDVISMFDIGEIYMPKASTTSKTFETLLTTIKSNNLTINTAKSDKVILSEDDIEITILSPISDTYDDLNNYSAVVKLEYGESSFLFMGDAEKPVEKELIKKYGSDLQADVLKAGHHGSRYSSTDSFLEFVSPEYAVISSGAGNSYGHPHQEAIDRLDKAGATILRTDELGEIIISCDDNDNFILY